ncbi:MAG: hypothetical protein A3I66_03590 [Burkholderiales bacterium RIFCSPLOWO2_02_FULL_57_36]|nr:MAG: hypothetical protein A3I66_03590 [Burkholderiales bacterium RIFCSPLOWO2_02_FULL_57_36]
MNDKLILSRVAAIQRYLEMRPDSADTLEGIHHYWVRSRGEETMEVTQAALDYLKVAGFIESSTTGNREIWRRPSPDTASSGD